MRIVMTSLAVLALMACNKPAENTVENIAEENMSMDANAMDATAMAPAALATINETSWEFIDNKTKKPTQESVDAAGKYITVSGKEHIDHGTAVMKDGKACFTSAMDKVGEVCWTDPMVAEGQSGETTSDKGDKLTVKRVAYAPLTM